MGQQLEPRAEHGPSPGAAPALSAPQRPKLRTTERCGGGRLRGGACTAGSTGSHSVRDCGLQPGGGELQNRGTTEPQTVPSCEGPAGTTESNPSSTQQHPNQTQWPRVVSQRRELRQPRSPPNLEGAEPFPDTHPGASTAGRAQRAGHIPWGPIHPPRTGRAVGAVAARHRTTAINSH